MCRRSSKSESGYILLAVLFMVVLILVALAVAAPRIATDIQRDREGELIHRGKQYTRAIKLYYKKFGRYPSSIDQLENTNNMRFLRKRYVDPMTGKDDWKIIHFGEAHVKATGLFGQSIQNAGTAGSSVLGGAPSITQSAPGGSTSPYSGTSSLGSTSSASSISSSSSTNSTGSDPFGNSGAPGTTNTGGTSSPFSSGAGTSSGTSQTFGGAPMVGVASKNTKASIKVYKQQKHYNEWEFVYDPIEDLMSSASLFGGGVGGAGNLNGTGTNSTGTNGLSTTPGSSGFSGTSNPGTGSPFNSSPTTGTQTNSPTSPQ
jgi:type II secretory pathway pseudopilin PulG